MLLDQRTAVSRPFAMVGWIEKASHAGGPDNSDWVLSGPITPDEKEGPDYDGQTISDVGLLKGLEMFDKLGGEVDWAHQYSKTHEPKWLIGKGTHFTGPDGRPWLKTKLFKEKSIAQQAWEHQNVEGRLGYSIEGLAKAFDPQNGKRIIETEIHRITIDPSPKGFSNKLQAGVPVGSVLAIAKAMMHDFTSGLCFEPIAKGGWSDLNEVGAGSDVAALQAQVQRLTKAVLTPLAPDQRRCPYCLRKSHVSRIDCVGCGKVLPVFKAFTTGSGVVQPNAQGGQADRVQSLAGAGAQIRCVNCGAKNKTRRVNCVKCNKPMVKPAAFSGR